MLIQNIISVIVLVSGLTINGSPAFGQNNIQIIKYIKHGTSFGECSGYCFEETKIERSKITEMKKTWRNDATYPEKNVVIKNSAIKWQSITRKVHLKAFYKLPEDIGCPDCADGGAEWVEISTGNKVHKVTFEFGADIKCMKELLVILRQNN